MRSAANGLKTAVLLGLLSAVCILVGGAVAGRGGLVIGLVVAVALNGYSYFFSDRIALKAMRARPVSEVEQPLMFAIVRELATAAGQPMPRLYVSPAAQPNAFATGRSPRHAAVAATEGLLRLLERRELRAVLGHELSHVYNRDILTASVAGAMASAVTFLSQFALFMGGGSRNRNPLATMFMALLGPLAAGLIQLAISRSREYQADQSGAELSGDPLALASALQKLQGGVEEAPLPQRPTLVSTSHSMIVNPFRGAGLAGMFATHPPMAQRVARLQEMAREDPRFWK